MIMRRGEVVSREAHNLKTPVQFQAPQHFFIFEPMVY